jgi:hypothetical protein
MPAWMRITLASAMIVIRAYALTAYWNLCFSWNAKSRPAERIFKKSHGSARQGDSSYTKEVTYGSSAVAAEG